MTIQWIGDKASPTVLMNDTKNNQTLKALKITNNEELLKYLKENLDININLDLHLKNGNALRLNFKKDLTDIKNKAATKIQATTRRLFASRFAKLSRKLKPTIVNGTFRNFSVLTDNLTKEEKKFLKIYGKGKKRKFTKRKGKKRQSTKRKSTKKVLTRRIKQK
tara:strand:+ start:1696 stop:2187 length:492 start_codon:yes stop_codon:yes gene_type:complete